MTADTAAREPDAVLVGAGIMSATLGVLLKQFEPGWNVELYEVLEHEAEESSGAWNNAGTGHAALCELNYTPQLPDGSIDISKALEVNTEFDSSRQLWSYLISQGAIDKPELFIHPVPHMSFVQGRENVDFLKKRHAALTAHHCYHGMEYTEDKDQLAEWVPLVMDGRDPNEVVAATRMITGSDVDYGALTRALMAHLRNTDGFTAHFRHHVENLERQDDGRWRVDVKDLASGQRRSVKTKFVFLGAGGGALPLLQKSQIPEGRGYAGFPVSGIWLRTDNTELADRHQAKVYGKAASGSPPMSVPHLDARVIDGSRHLLFGPYAGFSSKFLKHGSYADMFRSMRPGNIGPMLAVARHQFKLSEYLVGQVVESKGKRFDTLRSFYPKLSESDWRLQEAGQRVQIIKRDPKERGVLEFGTEVVHAGDGSLSALLGASPGASTAVAIMVGLVEQCFAEQVNNGWGAKLQEMIPSYGKSLIDDADLCRKVRADTAQVLHLQNV